MESVLINLFLSSRGVTFDDMNAMVYGLLEDKTNYGDPERESMAEDLNTTIPVSGDGWTAIRGVKVGDRRQESGVRSLESGDRRQEREVRRGGTHSRA